MRKMKTLLFNRRPFVPALVCLSIGAEYDKNAEPAEPQPGSAAGTTELFERGGIIKRRLNLISVILILFGGNPGIRETRQTTEYSP